MDEPSKHSDKHSDKPVEIGEPSNRGEPSNSDKPVEIGTPSNSGNSDNSDKLSQYYWIAIPVIGGLLLYYNNKNKPDNLDKPIEPVKPIEPPKPPCIKYGKQKKF
jgi:hypothetical protein